MLDTNLIAQTERLTSIYREIARSSFPYDEVRKLLREHGTSSDELIPDLDLYFSTLAGYCSWGKRLLMWDDEKVQEARAYVALGFFDRHPEYEWLGPLIRRSNLIKQLGTYDELRKGLFTLLVALEQYRKACDDRA